MLKIECTLSLNTDIYHELTNSNYILDFVFSFKTLSSPGAIPEVPLAFAEYRINAHGIKKQDSIPAFNEK